MTNTKKDYSKELHKMINSVDYEIHKKSGIDFTLSRLKSLIQNIEEIYKMKNAFALNTEISAFKFHAKSLINNVYVNDEEGNLREIEKEEVSW
jgi:UDP-N-acetylenolpyruvoylglucosamine reductase